MDAFTTAIQKYLRENEEQEAAQFLEGCIVENRFKEIVSGMNDDFETEFVRCVGIRSCEAVLRYHN